MGPFYQPLWPAGHGFRFHDDENLPPETPKDCPEESAQGIECWPRAFAFEDSALLTKREDLKSRIGGTRKKTVIAA